MLSGKKVQVENRTLSIGVPAIGERIMKGTMCLWLGWCLMSTATAQEAEKKPPVAADPVEKSQAVEILKKADEATKAVKLVRYRGRVKATGWLAARVPLVEGTAVIGGEFTRTYQVFRFDVEVREDDAAEPNKFKAGGNGEMFFLLDMQKKIAHQNANPTAIGSDGRRAQLIGMPEFVHPTPFSDEINGEKEELKGTDQVGGHECHVIHVVYGFGRGQEATWYFSKKDFLPRGVDRIMVDPRSGKGALELVITDLVVDPKLDKDTFTLVLPEGFKKTERSAPNRSLPR